MPGGADVQILEWLIDAVVAGLIGVQRKYVCIVLRHITNA